MSEIVCSSSLEISNNAKLENLSFPSLERLESASNNQGIYVNKNNILTSINFPILEGFYHSLCKNNPELTEITIPNSKFFGKACSTSTGLYIHYNNKLQLVQVNALEKVYNSIEISHNNIFDVSSINNCDFFVVNNDDMIVILGKLISTVILITTIVSKTVLKSNSLLYH